MNVFLIGYMGCGKSTVGKLLASKLYMKYIDFDTFLETQIGLTISDMFKQKGEIFFRKLENKHLDTVLALDNNVVAFGGGTPCYGTNMDELMSSSNNYVVYLKASVDVLTERLLPEIDKRPLISHLKNIEDLNDFIRKHLFERSYYYNKAHKVINVDNLSPEEVANEIIINLA